MRPLDALLDLLPDPWTLAEDSVLAGLLDVAALELETVAEDLDRLRRSHWVSTAERIEDLAGLAAVVGLQPLPWESAAAFRERLDATVVARRRGSVGRGELKRFVHDYLADTQSAQGATFVGGLRAGHPVDAAFDDDEDAPAHRRLAFLEFPRRAARSQALLAVGGIVPYLFRWTERNAGLFDTLPEITVTGLGGGRTAVPVVVNLTSGQLIGYAGVVPTGRRVTITATDPRGRVARAVLDGRHDVTDRLFSLSGFRPGRAFSPEDLDAEARVPRLDRGDSEWWYLAPGLHDVGGLDHVFLALADLDLREATFGGSTFDHALFPSGPAAGLALQWTEREPATFRVRVPAGVVVEPRTGRDRIHPKVVSTLRSTVEELRAAGIAASVEAAGLRERQPMRVRVDLPWVRTPRDLAPSGEGESLELGARFGDSGLGGSRFE
jgi:hypothetical protein